MVIQTVPDIFVTGHVHGHHASQYKGTHIIHSSDMAESDRLPANAGIPAPPMHTYGGESGTHAVASIPFV